MVRGSYHRGAHPGFHIFGVVSAAFVCAIFGLLGVVMGICYRYKVSAAKTLFAGAAVVLIALVAEGIAALYLLGIPSLLFGGEGMAQMKDSMLEVLPSFYSGEALDQAKEKVEFLMDAMEKSVPYTLVAVSVFYSWASMTLGAHIFKKMGISDIPHLPPFERWEFPKGTILLYLVVLGCQYFSRTRSRCPMWLITWAPSVSPSSGSRGWRWCGGCPIGIP